VLHKPIIAKIILMSEIFMKNIALIIKINLKGQFKRVITNLILVSILLLLVVVKINIIKVK